MENMNLNLIKYDDKLNKPQILCLGFFDAMHIGHLRLINKAKTLKYTNNAQISVFTFSNNPLTLFSNQKLIYTFEERLSILEDMEIDNVLYANFDEDFSKIDREQFLNSVFTNKNIIAVICGEDYTFGAYKKGNVEYLKYYLNAKKIPLYVIDLLKIDNKKVASNTIREKLVEGDLDFINKVLYMQYFVEGVVEKGKGIGHKDIFPTANIEINVDKQIIKPGVYYTSVYIDGVHFRAVTNVGDKPTLLDDTMNIETYILYYSKDLYGKKIRVEFIEKIRDIKKFESKEKLKEQIAKDVKYVLGQNGGIDD